MAAWLQAIKPRLLYVVAGLVIGSLIAGTICTYLAERSTAKTQLRILTAAGWSKAKVSKHPERVAPDIDLGPLEVAKVKPVAAGYVRTQIEYVPIPIETVCPASVAPPALPEPGGQSGSLSAPPPLQLRVDGQFLAGLTARQDLLIEGRLWADLALGEWSDRRELMLETIELEISHDLRRALRRGTRKRFNLVPSLRGIKVGWQAGLGVCFNQGAEPCVYGGYGVSF